jgi:hypothetical protein
MIPTSSPIRSAWRAASPVTWKVLVAFALGCLVSWQATRMSFREQQKWLQESLQHSYPKEQKLRATIARLILSGQGDSWAERQLRELPFTVLNIYDNGPDNSSRTGMLCEFQAMYSTTGREVKPFFVPLLEEIEAKGICKNYRLAPF